VFVGSFSKLPETMTGVAEQVSKEVNKSLADRGFPPMREEQQQLLKGQIVAIAEPDNAIYRLMSKITFALAHVIPRETQA
jgi:hypothetical protein